MGNISSKLFECIEGTVTFLLLLLIINLYEKPKINKKEEIINENKKSKEFVSKIDVPKEINKISQIITTSITQHDLEIVQLNNPKKEVERQKEIETITNNLLNSKMTQREYIENVKNSIIYETFHNPDKFVKKEETENSKEGSTLFIEGAL